MSLEEQEIIAIMKKGYCLWIGAGITNYLSKIGNQHTPFWKDLIEDMENDSELSHISSLSYPQRLGIIHKKLKHYQFQKMLREKLLIKLSISIIKCADNQVDTNKIIPKEVTKLAQLGMLANPIVNFNIETLTSFALAQPGGNFSIKSFNPPIPESTTLVTESENIQNDIFKRHIYHPHGSIELNGTCVMTDKEYKSLEGTLAFQIAVHAAFMSNLIIVGMSLDDIYLRNQISKFRSQIKKIIWFIRKKPKKEISEWAMINNIDIIKLKSWNYFWKTIIDKLPKPENLYLVNTWMTLVQHAFENLEPTQLKHLIDWSKERGSTDFQLSNWYKLGTNRGEDLRVNIDSKLSHSREEIIGKILKEISQIPID